MFRVKPPFTNSSRAVKANNLFVTGEYVYLVSPQCPLVLQGSFSQGSQGETNKKNAAMNDKPPIKANGKMALTRVICTTNCEQVPPTSLARDTTPIPLFLKRRNRRHLYQDVSRVSCNNPIYPDRLIKINNNKRKYNNE